MMGRLFIARQAAAIIGTKVASLRDWRRRGFLDGVGVLGSNGRDWEYTEKECQAIAEAYRKSKIPSPTIGDFIKDELDSQL